MLCSGSGGRQGVWGRLGKWFFGRYEASLKASSRVLTRVVALSYHARRFNEAAGVPRNTSEFFEEIAKATYCS